MGLLKTAIVESSALISIDYATDHAVYLLVDSSVCGVGWILAQDSPSRHCCPARFGSIAWNKCKNQYSQAKLELYGLFRVLRASRLHLISIRNLIVEVDASYIKGMLSNPNIQPNATINCWITAILLFDFKLVHVLVDKHKGPNGLSRCEPAPGKEEDDDPEDWVNYTLSLGTWVVSWLNTFPADAHSPGTLILLLVTSDKDTDSVQTSQSHHDHRLPVQYHHGNFITTDMPRTPSSCQLPIANILHPTLCLENTNANIDNNNNNNDYSHINNTTNSKDAMQQLGIPLMSRGRAQSQATTGSNTPTNQWNSQGTEGIIVTVDNDDGGEESNADNSGSVSPSFYTDFDKLARTSNNNNNSSSKSYQNPRHSSHAINNADSMGLIGRSKLSINNAGISDGDNNHNNIIDNVDHLSTTPQNPDNSDISSEDDNSMPVKFSTSDKVNKADAEIKQIYQYLLSQRAPLDLPADMLTSLISRARHFLIAGGHLWQ